MNERTGSAKMTEGENQGIPPSYEKIKIFDDNTYKTGLLHSRRSMSFSIFLPGGLATASANRSDGGEVRDTLNSALDWASWVDKALMRAIFDQIGVYQWWKIARVVVPDGFQRRGVGSLALQGLCSRPGNNAFIAAFSRTSYSGDIDGFLRFFSKSGFSLVCKDSHAMVTILLPILK
jgi:hypothetical protein